MTRKQKTTLKSLQVIRHPVGGIRTHLAGLLKAPEFASVTGEIVLPDVDEGRELEGQIAETGFRCVFTRPSSRDLVATAARLVLSGGYDVVHAHGFTAGALTVPVCRFIGMPILTTAHDVFTEQQFSGLAGIANRMVMASTLRLSTVIHCVTEDAADNLRQYLPRIPARKIRIIPHGIDVRRFRDAPTRDLRQELGLSGGAVLIGFFGRFMAQKGFRVLLKAVRQCLVSGSLPTTTYIVCFENGGFLREDKLEAEAMGLGPNLRVLPFTPFIGPEIKGVDLVAMPSLWEASGLLAMEALVAGTPLIASSCTGLRETIAGTPAIACPPGDVDALANALGNALATSGTRGIFQAYRAEAGERFDNAVSYQLIRELYSEIAKGK
jgi:glycosyltransferase involved in cell wall biosynthesis